MRLYLLCDTICLLAHLALAFVACRERLYWPMAYAGFCAVCCAASLVGVASEAFRAAFLTSFLPVFIAGWLLYGIVFLSRLRAGITAPEMLLSAALLCGVGASIAAGFLERPGYFRLAIQTGAVVVPILISIVTLGPRPLPEPVVQPAIYAHTNMPVPQEVQ